MLIKFITALAFIVGMPCAIAVVVLLMGIAFIKESRERNYPSLRFYFLWGILAWAWLIAKFWM